MSDERAKKRPLPQRDPKTGMIPGSIGDLSARLGRDVRELIMDGYSWSDIHAMIAQREQRLGKKDNDTQSA